MADLRLPPLGGAGDPLDAAPDDDRPDTAHPRGERRETLEAAIGRPLAVGDEPATDPDQAQPGDWKGDPD